MHLFFEWSAVPIQIFTTLRLNKDDCPWFSCHSSQVIILMDFQSASSFSQLTDLRARNRRLERYHLTAPTFLLPRKSPVAQPFLAVHHGEVHRFKIPPS
jgi:hypothetical protein